VPVKPELDCRAALEDISPLLDGELNVERSLAVRAHVEACPQCAQQAQALDEVRRALRTQPAGEVPDVTAAVMRRVERQRQRRRVAGPLRVAGVAAAVAALLLTGSSLIGTRRPRASAQASEVTSGVREAARSLDSYRARFEIVERGWHEAVPLRRFDAEVSFSAPESFRLTIRDNTSYPDPSQWPPNDVDLIVNARRSWIREPQLCPEASLPACWTGTSEERTVVARQPFDGAAGHPSDLIVPLETLSTSELFELLGRERMLGRSALHVALPHRQAVPLISALQQGGSWREFSPSDRVDVWLDSETWFPLRFDVRRGRSSAGQVLLSARATSFSQPQDFPPGTFRAPIASLQRSGGFEQDADVSFDDNRSPEFIAGLRPYRAGKTSGGERILSFARGLTWLTMSVERSAKPPRGYPSTAEQVPLAGSGVAYYEPASSASRRRVDLYASRTHASLESNLPRAVLLRVASSLDLVGRPLPAGIERSGLRVSRLGTSGLQALAFAETPTHLPPGYRTTSSFLVENRSGHRTLSVYYRRAQAEYDGLGIRTTQSPSVRFLPPSFEDLQPITVDGLSGRWSAQRGEVEWMDHGVYRSVRAPSLGRKATVQVARSLE
jgi:outer membrane lipoprotein-sorting protein